VCRSIIPAPKHFTRLSSDMTNVLFHTTQYTSRIPWGRKETIHTKKKTHISSMRITDRTPLNADDILLSNYLSHILLVSAFHVDMTEISISISVINQRDAQNVCFTISLFHASTYFEHMCSSSGGQNCITQPLLS